MSMSQKEITFYSVIFAIGFGFLAFQMPGAIAESKARKIQEKADWEECEQKKCIVTMYDRFEVCEAEWEKRGIMPSKSDFEWFLDCNKWALSAYPGYLRKISEAEAENSQSM